MSVFLRTDVTAVKLFNNFILAGIGSSIHIFHIETQKIVHQLKTLKGQKIYGIIPSAYHQNILIFGGKQYTILCMPKNISDGGQVDLIFDSISCDDWLHSGVWLTKTQVALLTAHNVVQIWNIESQVIESSHECVDNSILYSGLLLPLKDDIIAFSGTVYSEVIIQSCSLGVIHYLKGHKGVIFSVSCDPAKGIIVTTSDDRSVRIWGMCNSSNKQHNYKDYWKNITISCLHELYGHTARVMRSCITNDCIVSVGEDSGICFWDFEGKLLRKVMSHQNGCVWSVDANDTHLITGGGDCGVTLHPLSLKSEYGTTEIVNFELKTPRMVKFTARNNLIIIDGNYIIYYDLTLKCHTEYKLNHESTYQMLSISTCKQVIAVADMSGKLDIFVENCKGDPMIKNIINTKLNVGKILSLHWGSNRHLVVCSDDGNINVLASKDAKTEIFATFLLPPCKEQWLTSAALTSNNILIVGDRCGHIHIYTMGGKSPVKSFDRVHGRYGATSISIKDDEIVTTGRNGAIKYFTLSDNAKEIKYMRAKDVEFQWIEKFIDRNYTYICGFQERTFVVHDVENNTKIVEVHCGGGHRSWDVERYFDKVDDNFKECIRFVYVKNSNIHLHTFQLDKIVAINIVNGIHPKEINCLKTYSCDVNKSISFFLSGGEDTTLRVSALDNDTKFRDELIFKHLSSIRTLKILALDKNKIVVVSGGGRAQICIKYLTFIKTDVKVKIVAEELVDYLIKGTDKERKGNQTWRSGVIDFDPETRIMDLEIAKRDDNFFIIAACSDAILRTFKLVANKLIPLKEIKHHRTCILKTHLLRFENKDLLVTCTTRGEVTFWDVSKVDETTAIFSTFTNKSGINSISSKVLKTEILIATAGDDNAIHLTLLDVGDNLSMKINNAWSTNSFHSSQITGLILLDDMMISASVDQRITLFKISLGTCIKCDFVSQTFSDVADIQGMDILEVSEKSVSVCVYGKGIEVIQVPAAER